MTAPACTPFLTCSNKVNTNTPIILSGDQAYTSPSGACEYGHGTLGGVKGVECIYESQEGDNCDEVVRECRCLSKDEATAVQEDKKGLFDTMGLIIIGIGLLFIAMGLYVPYTRYIKRRKEGSQKYGAGPAPDQVGGPQGESANAVAQGKGTERPLCPMSILLIAGVPGVLSILAGIVLMVWNSTREIDGYAKCNP
eukprot:gnl/TRDRNA2_/TRDRNA2_173846_c0_seq2.p1 gnl/TRDRNA2_/TRDRNA2_173846_c0~~gnl/TRDRNA2_/TRDRNA2_173846_c0_seq2.p1  ORF type:complete len:215 (-),score=9.30 gnl/TRDRNA2_/TRDRNA2_173846_c0_seq2:228-815(-)